MTQGTFSEWTAGNPAAGRSGKVSLWFGTCLCWEVQDQGASDSVCPPAMPSWALQDSWAGFCFPLNEWLPCPSGTGVFPTRDVPAPLPTGVLLGVGRNPGGPQCHSFLALQASFLWILSRWVPAAECGWDRGGPPCVSALGQEPFVSFIPFFKKR